MLVIVNLSISRRIATGVNVMKRVQERADIFEELDSCDVGRHDFRGISERRFGGRFFWWYPTRMTLPQWMRNSTQLLQTAHLGGANNEPNRIGPDPFDVRQLKNQPRPGILGQAELDKRVD